MTTIARLSAATLVSDVTLASMALPAEAREYPQHSTGKHRTPQSCRKAQGVHIDYLCQQGFELYRRDPCEHSQWGWTGWTFYVR